MSETNGTIKVGPCRCPGEIHEEDWVELYPELTLAGGLRVANTLAPDSGYGNIPEMSTAVILALMETEISAWSFIDEQGPVPIPGRITGSKDRQSTLARLLPFAKGGAVLSAALTPRVREAAQTDPFKVATTRKSSKRGRTAPSTSATPDS